MQSNGVQSMNKHSNADKNGMHTAGMDGHKKRIFMLGAGFMQGVAIRAAHALGCTVVAADGNPSAACAAEADEFICIDLKDTARLVEYAKQLQQNGGLDAVFTAATDFSAAVAAVAVACGLRGHRPEAALNATDKVRMRKQFQKHGIPSPAFTEFTAANLSAALHDPTALTGMLGDLAECFPLVIKPVDNMGARGCSLVNSRADLREAAETALRYSRSGRVIVEEYIEGKEFSIEGLVFGGKLFVTALADRHIFFPPYFIEMGHTIPSNCSQEVADEVITVFEQGVQALGLTDGAVKGDMLVREGKAFVGEIAARLSGGYMSGWTVPYSSGLDITAAALTLALGGSPRLTMHGKDEFTAPLKQRCPFVSAERAWITIPGKIAAVSGLEAARAAPHIKAVFPRAEAGDTVVFPQNNVEKCGNVLSAAPDRREAVQASEAACRMIILRLHPHTAETEAFLSGLRSPAEQQTYPPNFLQFTEPPAGAADPEVFFSRLLEDAVYEKKEGFLLPDFLAAALDSARDLQGRTLRELLTQALEAEPGIASILCSSGQPDVGTDRLAEYDRAAAAQSDRLRKNRYWTALIRGGLQGLLYRYDCEQA